MLNAVSSGRRLANVTPVRSGDSDSKSCGSRARPQAASANAAASSTTDPSGIDSDDRWPLRFGSSTVPPHTPGSLTSGATGRVADSAGRDEQVSDAAATPRGGPGGEDARGRAGWL